MIYWLRIGYQKKMKKLFEIYNIGEIIVVNFPYSDFSHFKKRPALVVGEISGENTIIMPITTKFHENSFYQVKVLVSDIYDNNNNIIYDSYVNTDVILSIHKSKILKKLGFLSCNKVNKIKINLRNIFDI
jgi:mRNA interferase MazF